MDSHILCSVLLCLYICSCNGVPLSEESDFSTENESPEGVENAPSYPEIRTANELPPVVVHALEGVVRRTKRQYEELYQNHPSQNQYGGGGGGSNYENRNYGGSQNQNNKPYQNQNQYGSGSSYGSPPEYSGQGNEYDQTYEGVNYALDEAVAKNQDSPSNPQYNQPQIYIISVPVPSQNSYQRPSNSYNGGDYNQGQGGNGYNTYYGPPVNAAKYYAANGYSTPAPAGLAPA